MLNGPQTKLLRLIQIPAVSRQKIVSTISPKNAADNKQKCDLVETESVGKDGLSLLGLGLKLPAVSCFRVRILDPSVHPAVDPALKSGTHTGQPGVNALPLAVLRLLPDRMHRVAATSRIRIPLRIQIHKMGPESSGSSGIRQSEAALPIAW